MFRIYILTSPSGRCYVGQTKLQIEERLRQHQKSKNCSAIRAALKKYGRSKFYISELARSASQETANALEQYFIALLGTQRPHGYNITGGGSQQTIADETRKRMSASQKLAMLDPNLRRKRISYLDKNRRHRKGKAALNRVPIFCISNGITYSSITAAAVALNLDISTLSKSLRGSRGITQTGGFKFQAWE